MRLSLRLQALGWSMVAAIDFVLNRAANPSDVLGWALYASLSLAALGFAVSSALLLVYRSRALSAGRAAIGAAIAGAVLGGAAWYVLSHALDRAVGYPYGSPLVTGLFGKGALILFIMMAWHGGFLAVRASSRAAEAERLAQEARLLALRYQLNPHFLFNALNSAIALVDEAPERAQRMLTLLSGLLRDTLNSDPVAETTLGRELELIERYLEIERVRFEDDLRVELEVPDAARRCTIPPLLLHTLVENAVKHGQRTTTTRPLEIRITASYEGDKLRVEVNNSGSIAPRGDGVGLRNMVARLEASYPGRHEFEITERDGSVAATLEIDSPRVAA